MAPQREQGVDYVAFASLGFRFSGIIGPDDGAQDVLAKLTSPAQQRELMFEFENSVFVMKSDVAADLTCLLKMFARSHPMLTTAPPGVVELKSEQEVIEFFGTGTAIDLTS